MNSIILAGLALGLVGCSRSKPADRSLELAAQDSTYKANDRPAASPAVAPAAPEAPQPSGNARTAATGTTIRTTTDRTISSRHTKAGETLTTTVSADVKDAKGRVVIPAGSKLALTITEIQPANDKSKTDGRLRVSVRSVTVKGKSYPVEGTLTSMSHTLKGRGVGATEVEKAGAGAAAGAIAGRIIGGDAKGALIGGIVGAAAGTAVAVETANRDVVVAAGTPVVIKLTGPLTVAMK